MGERSDNPALRFFSHAFERRVAATFAAGARVLDLRAPLDDLVAEDLWDGAHAGPGALDGADLVGLGAALAGCLRPEAPVVLCIPGRLPLPALLQRAFRARGAWREGHSAADATWAMGVAFEWRYSSAFGVLVPGAAQPEWIRDHPQTFGLLAALEKAVRHWPLLRGLGEYTVMEGRRRGGSRR
jgi:hypothetical protein